MIINPFYLDLTEQEIENIQKEVGNILRSGTLILGKHTEAFEYEFAQYIGTKYAVSFNSGTSALQALLLLKNVRGKKIAVPTNTNFATVAAILREGGFPVYLDMNPKYFVPDLSLLQQLIEKYSDISGVVWVHIGGIITPDFEQVVEYCRLKNIFLIEDAAHAHGSRLRGVYAGNFADGGAFSFFPTKVMTTIEGGMITTNSQEEAILSKSIRNQGKRGGNYGGLHYDLGNSWRMSEIEAYIGLVQLAKLNQMIAHRTRAVKKIIPVLKACNIEYCDVSHMEQSSYYKFIIKFTNNSNYEHIKELFKQEGILLGGGVYEVPCHRQPVFKSIPFNFNEVINAEKYCPKHICLPITSGITEEQTTYLIKVIKKIFE